MKFYKQYIVLILVLAVTLNWVVEGSHYLGKVDMNLGLFPKMSITIIEFLQVFILIRIILLYPNNDFIMATIVGVALFCLLELAVLKALKTNISIWIAGIRYYFSFIPLVLIGYLLATGGESIKREFNWLLGLILLQIPVSIYQFMNVSKITVINDRQLLFDLISGTMGGIAPNLMSLLIGIGLLYFLIRYMEEKKFKYLLVSILLIVPPLLAEAKGMLLVILIVLGYLAFTFKFSLTRMLALGVIAIFLIVGFSYIYTLLGYGDSITISYLIEYANSESGTGRLSRIDSVFYSFSLLLKNGTLPLGMGIGNANKNPLGHDGHFYDFFTIRHSLDILITETGLLGLAFFSIIILKLFYITNSLLKNEANRLDKDDLLIARVFQGTMFIFLYGLLWVDVLFRVQFMYPFGLLAGFVIGLKYRMENEEKQQFKVSTKLQEKMV
ncbi:hypothetical protein ACSX1A_09925 [Pontibacter sp. MBLB2868]|uniref:hypothetical protein n=1 Tax=Pontibacter sp. MBLB2868 TaxID=3451555 RepID=UPI003F74DCC0